MTSLSSYPPEQTALLLVDPYNDLLSEGRITWSRANKLPRNKTCSIICAGSSRRRA